VTQALSEALPKGSKDPKVTGIAFAVGAKPGSSGNFDADAKRIKQRLAAYYQAGSDTQSMFDWVNGAQGKYTAAREEQQAKVIDHFLNAPGVKSERKLFMLGGLPGAGKTSFLNSKEGQSAVGGFNKDEYVNVNPDDIKDYMAAHGMAPAYPGLTPGEAVGLYHEEASDISKLLLEAAAAQGKNIVFDVTLKNPGQAAKATDVLDRQGDHYHRTLVFIDVPAETAAQRAQHRYQHGEGRFVPVGNILEQADPTGERHSLNRHAFEAVKGEFDVWVLVDNTNADGAGPKILGHGGKAKKTT